MDKKSGIFSKVVHWFRSWGPWIRESWPVMWILEGNIEQKLLITRQSQELYGVFNSIFRSFASIEDAIEECTNRNAHPLIIDEEKMRMQTVLEILIQNLREKQNAFPEKMEESFEGISRNVTPNSLRLFLDENKSLGQKLRIIKKTYPPEVRGNVIVTLAFNFDLAIGKLLARLENVKTLVSELDLGNMSLQDLRSGETKHLGWKSDDFQFGNKLLGELEKVLQELQPISDDFSLRVSKLATALEDRNID